MPATETLKEAKRVMQVCNACRYCEGFCAVFPAMNKRLTFSDGDVTYLANLCHGCQGCYYACQYAPPHEFAVNVPKTFAELRGETYRDYAWPGVFKGLFEGSIGLRRIDFAILQCDHALGHHLAHVLARDPTLACVFGLTDKHLRHTFPCSGRP